jgi:hypothetical protein
MKRASVVGLIGLMILGLVIASPGASELVTTAYLAANSVTSFFGNQGAITSLADPTTITDAAGNTIGFSSANGGTISVSDANGDNCNFNGNNGVVCTDSSGDALSLNGGIFSLADSNGDQIISQSSGLIGLVVGSNGCQLNASTFTCGLPIIGTNSPLQGTTGSIGGSALLAGACSSGTATVSGATTAMVSDATPVSYPGDAFFWKAYVSGTNTVTVKVCAAIAGTPTATTYNVRVIQ